VPTSCEEGRLFSAATSGDLDEVKLLLEHGADPNVKDNDGRTPLHYAADFDHPEVVKLLLEHGANPNIQENKYGWTPLHYAAEGCHVGVARVLLDHGADPTIRDNEGRTPLDIGSDCGEIREMLRRGGTRTTVYK
jgi:ankyrin repeat protein